MGHGSILHFLLRLNPTVLKVVEDRFKLVYPHVSMLDYAYRTNPIVQARLRRRLADSSGNNDARTRHISVGVHLRAGAPDGGRQALTLDDVMKQLDATVERVRLRGDIVSKVFICSDTQDTNIRSSEYMASAYPRNFTYVVLPHLNYSTGTEAEFAMRDDIKNHVNIKFQVFAEFMTDVLLLVHSDVFLGSHSNVYVTVAALRMALFPGRPVVDTGYLDSHFSPPRYMGEGEYKNRGTPIFHNGYGGFDGGTSFW
jgi:hypothetical protein